MTSISAAGSSFSPLQLLQSQLQKDVSAGQISAADQSTLSDALTSIDSSLQSDRSSQTQGGAPGAIKSKIDGLIAQQVQAGSLTSDQASELQKVFSDTFAGGSGGAAPSAAGPRRGPRPRSSRPSSSSA